MAPRFRYLVLLLAAGFACSSAGDEDDSTCLGGKCDKPDDLPPEDACTLRRAEALESSQRAYVRDAIRWACADINGVNTNTQDDRGQEYCEYFAIVQPPSEVEGGEPPPAQMLGRGTDNESLSIQLTEEQIFALEDDPDAVVGQCVFTSWHQDAPGPLPACDETCPAILGFEMSEQNFQMLAALNSASAARHLVGDCFGAGPAGDPDDPEDPLHSDYYRGCMRCGELFESGLCMHWRRSDPTICAAVTRLAECGCGFDVDGDGVADEVDPAEELIPRHAAESGGGALGFPLGTWSGPDQLPAACRYADTGDESQTIVTCDLTAADLLASASDPKGRCRDKYGDNVVVHVPITPERIVCRPDESTQYGATCGAEPWLLDH